MAVVSAAVPGDLRQTARHRAQSDVTNQLYGSHIGTVNRMVRIPSSVRHSTRRRHTRSTFQDYCRKAHLKRHSRASFLFLFIAAELRQRLEHNRSS